jgi:hypothetical protein
MPQAWVRETPVASLELDDFRTAGAVHGRTLADAMRSKRVRARLRRRTRALRSLFTGVEAHPSTRPHREWLSENGRLLATSVKDVQHLVESASVLPAFTDATGTELRVCRLARVYLERADWRYDDEQSLAFLRGACAGAGLTLGEIWAMKPALQICLLERLLSAVTTGEGEIPVVVNSLRQLSQARWKTVFAAVNPVDPILARDPAGAYGSMEEESQEEYRRMVSELSLASGRSEPDVAGEAIALARTFAAQGATGRAAERRTHVGYYLIDKGLPLLRRRVGYRATLQEWAVDLIRRHPSLFYLGAIAAVTAALLATLIDATGWSQHAVAAALLLVVPASQAAIDVVNALVSRVIGPRRLPKLDFERGVPDGCTTLVAVPALLIDERHVRELVMDMEIRYLGNRDPNIMFALVTNARDTTERPREGEGVLRLAEQLVGELNARYGSLGHTPFYLLHRFRAYNASENRWIGWERKRGKLLDLNQLLRGVRDRFPVKVGNVAALRRTRYVIVLDSDTELPRDAARRLIGAIAHPLNRAVLDPVTSTVVEGYGILQPRVSVSTGSAARSWLANLYSGETGFDIYTRAVSDVYQDLFGEGSFTGKGIYEVDVFRPTLEHRFPTNALLSHDLIEGLFARAGLVSDVEVIDDYPSHFSAYSRRRHRWMRGDWQLVRWLPNLVPDGRHRLVQNPLDAIARWKILDNLRRTLVEVSTLALLLSVWFLFPSPGAWTAIAVGILLAPTYSGFLLAVTRAPWWTSAFKQWAIATVAGFLRAHVIVLIHLAYLLHDAMLSLDAILRSLVRVFVTRRRLLQWETAAEASRRSRGSTDIYLDSSPAVAAAIAGLLAWARPEALLVAAPLVVLWSAAGVLARWLNQPPPSSVGSLEAEDVKFLRAHALRTWRFFATFSTPENHWLIPDSVRRDGTAVDRVSPTNVAMLLNARVSAVQFGYLTIPEFVVQTRRTLATIERLSRYRGHLLNWYDARTLQVLEPRFVSTVDSGNLAAALWSLKQAALAFAEAPPADDVLWNGIADVARQLGTDDDPAAQALCERVLRTQANWRHSLRELEALALGHAAAVGTDPEHWAFELLARLRHARIWCESGLSPALRASLSGIARTAHALVDDMNFACLYNGQRKVLSVGIDTTTGIVEDSAYDLLASESRTASFVAIAKGDIPQESWAHLGRPHVKVAGQRVLLSWTGTLFEYVMPALWIRHRPHTIMHDSMRAAVAAQRTHARRHGIPWGFSESQFVVPGAADLGYGPCGMPGLALKPLDTQTLVVSPYASWLALLVDRAHALENLKRLEEAGAGGAFGFYEALDYSRGTVELVESWMAHHQGMSLLAAAELLCGAPLQTAFHAEPQVRATERLLEERVPRTIVPDKTEAPCVVWPEESVA